MRRRVSGIERSPLFCLAFWPEGSVRAMRGAGKTPPELRHLSVSSRDHRSSSGRLPPCDFRPEQGNLEGERRGDAGALAHALEIGLLHVWIEGEVDFRRRLRPAEHGREIGVGDAKAIEQEFPALELLVEISEPGGVFAD